MDQRGLVEQAQRGDHDAFAVLTRAAIARLDAAARLILRDRELAWDAVQDTLLNAWRNLPGLRDPERTLPDDGLHAPRANRGPAGACVRSAADSLTFAPYPDRTTSVSPLERPNKPPSLGFDLMSKLFVTASLLAVLAIAACSPAAGGPSAVPPSPSEPPTVEPPTVEPPASDPPVVPAPTPTDAPARPAPDPTEAPEKPDPAIVEFTDGEIYLADGILRGVMDCEPVRDKLPKLAVAGIECIGDAPAVARVGFYLFENDEEMLDYYFARMAREGVERDMGDCYNNEGEGAYIPGEEEVASRYGCFITAEGVANYRMTLPGAHVYLGIVGLDSDPIELVDFAFLGNRDTPSSPTLWGNPNS